MPEQSRTETAVANMAEYLKTMSHVLQTGQGTLSPIQWPQLTFEEVQAYFQSSPPVSPEMIQLLKKTRYWFSAGGFQRYYTDENPDFWPLFDSGQVWQFLEKRAAVGFRLFEDHAPKLFGALINHSGEDPFRVLAKLSLWVHVLVDKHRPSLYLYKAGVYFITKWYETMCGLKNRSIAIGNYDLYLYYILMAKPAGASPSVAGLGNEPVFTNDMTALLQIVRQHLADLATGKMNGYFEEEEEENEV